MNDNDINYGNYTIDHDIISTINNRCGFVSMLRKNKLETNIYNGYDGDERLKTTTMITISQAISPSRSN